MHQPPHKLVVTPAKAGGHRQKFKFQRQVMDSRLRRNDEVWFRNAM